ncbi:hypothetical protein EBME_2359 [bacterium endosymbiont of Mortierella elongata FMR23-6]|nr:hypothetical protein EBME_2359 [bacterium endosymbiont of Mortierella elongata FMR23-6]
MFSIAPFSLNEADLPYIAGMANPKPAQHRQPENAGEVGNRLLVRYRALS